MRNFSVGDKIALSGVLVAVAVGVVTYLAWKNPTPSKEAPPTSQGDGNSINKKLEKSSNSPYPPKDSQTSQGNNTLTVKGHNNVTIQGHDNTIGDHKNSYNEDEKH